MASRLSAVERQAAYRLLEVQERELLEIEGAPFAEAVARLAALKERVKKRFKCLVRAYHPDHHPGDPEKAAQLIVLLEVTKELYARQVKPVGVVERAPVVEPPSPAEVPKPFMRMHVKRPSSAGLGLSQKAIRLGKMKP